MQKYAIEYLIIPGAIYNDENLTTTAKLLFPVISMLISAGNHEACTNAFLSTIIGKAEATTRRAIKNLEDCKYIKRGIIKNDQGQWTRRFTINTENVMKSNY